MVKVHHLRNKHGLVQSPAWSINFRRIYMGVSKNMGTTKSSILIGFSTINHPSWGTPNFWKHPYSRRFIYCKSLWLLKTHILMVQWKWNISPRCSFTQTRHFQLNQEEVTISLFFSFFLFSFFLFPIAWARSSPVNENHSVQRIRRICKGKNL